MKSGQLFREKLAQMDREDPGTAQYRRGIRKCGFRVVFRAGISRTQALQVIESETAQTARRA